MLADSFWKRWSQEYVTQLTAYKKWAQTTPALQVGDVVLVSDDRLTRLLDCDVNLDRCKKYSKEEIGWSVPLL